MKNKLISLLSIPLFAFGLGSCNKAEKEHREIYNSSVVSVCDLSSSEDCYSVDLDNDKLVDAIISDHDNVALFYLEGYEGWLNLEKGRSMIMSPKIRKIASKLFNSHNDLNYEMWKSRSEMYLKESGKK